MKQKLGKKLGLHRETVLSLSRRALDSAQAGASQRSDCICPIESIGQCATFRWTNCTGC
ncbi:MAG TPA: hypothetical protein VN851_11240 [Thermoanaerobaculia bacterium]|nr:hypothetical protein [Thermoanaerobaculia bacterium]